MIFHTFALWAFVFNTAVLAARTKRPITARPNLTPAPNPITNSFTAPVPPTISNGGKRSLRLLWTDTLRRRVESGDETSSRHSQKKEEEFEAEDGEAKKDEAEEDEVEEIEGEEIKVEEDQALIEHDDTI
jgi:hypothetical protein